MKKLIIIGIVLALVVGGAIGLYMWNQPHRDIHGEKADFEVTAPDLAVEFQKDAKAAEKKYHDKVLSMKGVVSEITPGDSLTSLSLKGNDFCGVMCEMLPGTQESVSKIKVGDEVKIKAFYMGFIEGDADFGMPGDITFKKGIVE